MGCCMDCWVATQDIPLFQYAEELVNSDSKVLPLTNVRMRLYSDMLPDGAGYEQERVRLGRVQMLYYIYIYITDSIERIRLQIG